MGFMRNLLRFVLGSAVVCAMADRNTFADSLRGLDFLDEHHHGTGDAKDFDKLVASIKDKAIKEPLMRMQGLTGLDAVKTRMLQLVARLKLDKEREEKKLRPLSGMSMHMVFMGNPGTGKTVVARIVGELLVNMGIIKPMKEQAKEQANATGHGHGHGHGKGQGAAPEGEEEEGSASLVFREVSRSDLVAGYLGQTAPKVKKAVESALGGVLFIDEAYSLCQGCEAGHDSYGKEAVDTLIKEMEDKREHLIVILAGYEKEIGKFLSSNPGFQSRVPWQFHFQDYTCRQLVDIGEIFLHKKGMHIAFTGPLQKQAPELQFLCRDNPRISGCGWIRQAVTYLTGCCEEASGCQSERDNGNGRAVRNFLESTFRQTAVRVMQTYSQEDLEAFDRSTPQWPVDCRRGGDLRCAFLEVTRNDFAKIIAFHMMQDFVGACRASGSRAEVTADDLLGFKDRAERMNLLHHFAKLRKGATTCEEVEEMLNNPSGGRTRNSDSLLEVSEEGAELAEAAEEEFTKNAAAADSQDTTTKVCLSILEKISKDEHWSRSLEELACSNDQVCKNVVREIEKKNSEGYFLGGWVQESSHRGTICGLLIASQQPPKFINSSRPKPQFINSRMSAYGGQGQKQKVPQFIGGGGPGPGFIGGGGGLKAPTFLNSVTPFGGQKPRFLNGRQLPEFINSRMPTDFLLRQPTAADAGKLPVGVVGEMDKHDVPIGRDDTKAAQIMARLNKFVGLERVKATMLELKSTVEFDKWRTRWIGEGYTLLGQSFHMAFLGNPGTGKTEVGRIVGEMLVELGVISPKGPESDQGDGVKFREFARADLVAQYSGQTAIKVKEAVNRSLGGVMFIDEAYSLVKDRKGGRFSDSFGHEAVDELIKEMENERKHLIVILAGYAKEMDAFMQSNPGFKSRVPITFHFDDYTCGQLVEIGSSMLSGKGMHLASGAADTLGNAIRVTTGCCDDAMAVDCKPRRDNGNGRSVRNILEGSFRFAATRVMSLPSSEVNGFRRMAQISSEKAAAAAKHHCWLPGARRVSRTCWMRTFAKPEELPQVLKLEDPCKPWQQLNVKVPTNLLPFVRVKTFEGRPEGGATVVLADPRTDLQEGDVIIDMGGAKGMVDSKVVFEYVSKKILQKLGHNSGRVSVTVLRKLDMLSGQCASVASLQKADIDSMLQDTIYQRLHRLCTPGEGRAAIVDLARLRRLVRVLPRLEEAELATINQGGIDCEAAVEVLEGAVGELPGKEDNAMLDDPPEPDIRTATPEVNAIFDDIDELVGLTKIKAVMKELYALVEFSKIRTGLFLPPVSEQSFHMKFVGNPGTGKTVVARLVGEMLLEMGVVQDPSGKKRVSRRRLGQDPGKQRHAGRRPARGHGGGGEAMAVEMDPQRHNRSAGNTEEDEEEDDINFHEVSRAELVAQYTGQTAPKVQKAVKEALGGVLFIDEAYSLVQRGDDSFGREAVDALIKEMEDKRKFVVVILAGYVHEMDAFFESNPGFKSRVPITFQFDDYLCEELLDISALSFGKMSLSLPGGEGRSNWKSIVQFKSGCCDAGEGCRTNRDNGNGRTVRNLVDDLVRLMSARLATDGRKHTLEELTTFTPSDLSELAEEKADETLGRACAVDGMLDNLVASITKGELHEMFGGSSSVKQVVKVMHQTQLASAVSVGGDKTAGAISECRSLIGDFQKMLQWRVGTLCKDDQQAPRDVNLWRIGDRVEKGSRLNMDKIRARADEAEAMAWFTDALEVFGADDAFGGEVCSECATTCGEARRKLDTLSLKVDMKDLLEEE